MINESADSLNDVAALLLWTIGWREEELQTYYCGTAMRNTTSFFIVVFIRVGNSSRVGHTNT